MIGGHWQAQWERVGRRLDDVRATYGQWTKGTDSALDAVQAFFEGIHHLRDWLSNDSACTISDKQITSFVKGSVELSICGDLANGAKHLKLSTTWTGDLTTSVARNGVTVIPGTGAAAHRFYIQSGGREFDALDLAERAYIEWRTFLSGRGLL